MPEQEDSTRNGDDLFIVSHILYSECLLKDGFRAAWSGLNVHITRQKQ